MNRSYLYCAALAMLAMTLVSDGNAQTGGSKSTTIRPTDNEKLPNTKMAHEELLKHVRDLNVRMELIQQTMKTLDDAPITDRATAIKKNVLTLTFEKDIAGTYPRLEASVENLRWNLYQDHTKKQALATRRLLDVGKTQFDIDKHADGVIQLEERIAAATGAEREELEHRLADHKAELNELVGWRVQQEADARRLSEDAGAFKRELQELGQLQRHVDSLNRQARTRIARLVDQVEYQQIAGVSEEIETARKTISEVMGVLKNRPASPPLVSPPALPGTESVPIVRPAPIPQPDSEAIRAELQKARERAAKQKKVQSQE